MPVSLSTCCRKNSNLLRRRRIHSAAAGEPILAPFTASTVLGNPFWLPLLRWRNENASVWVTHSGSLPSASVPHTLAH